MANLDSLRGTACNVGTTNEGTLAVSYTSGTGAVAMRCNPTGGQSLSVTIVSVREANCDNFNDPCDDGEGRVSSIPGGIVCQKPSIPDSPCFAVYGPTTTVMLIATPLPGSFFAGWEGTCPSGNSSPCTVTMSHSRTIRARFQAFD